MEHNIAVFGQGYVGLPLSLSFAIHGCHVIGVDNNQDLVDCLTRGITYQTEKYQGTGIREILKQKLAEGTYQVTADGASAVRKSDTVIITVGLPVEDGVPYFGFLESAVALIGDNLKKGTLILLRTTVVPGTTETFCIPLLEERSGLKVGKDFSIAYIPERIAEGKAFDEFENMPTIIGAYDKKSLELASEVIKINCQAELITSDSIRAVETSKVLENLQRDTNIAMSQEFARYAEAVGIDIFEVIRLANTHKRVNILTPGPGVGGYCIPNAFHYLNASAREVGVSLPLLELARKKNAALPVLIIQKTADLLQQCGKSITGAKIAVLGLAMKDYSPDPRLSPAVEICELLLEAGARISAYDSNVSHHFSYKVDDFSTAMQDADALLILNRVDVDFDPVKYIDYMVSRPVVLDTRNSIDPMLLPAGAIFWRI